MAAACARVQDHCPGSYGLRAVVRGGERDSYGCVGLVRLHPPVTPAVAWKASSASPGVS
jgi:hypothetical protein